MTDGRSAPVQEADRRAAALVAALELSCRPGQEAAPRIDLGPPLAPDLERRMFDRIGLALARRYAQGLWSWELCDALANSLWALMLRRIAPDAPGGVLRLAPLMDAVFLAFDVGEAARPGDPPDLDPVAARTDPAIARILSQAGEGPLG